MCHNSVWEEEEHDEQIDKCVENGMPQKIVKSLKFTIRKRIEKHEHETKQHDEPKMVTSSSYVEQMKHPTTEVSAAHIMHQQSVAAVASTNTPFIPQMCGRFRSSLSTSKADVAHGIANISGHSNSSNKLDQTFYTDDNLAKSVQFTRIWAARVYCKIRNMQNTRIYLLLTGTAQPAHVITIAILSFVLFAVWPELIGWKNTSQSSIEDNGNGKYVNGTNRLAMVIYLGAFATHFGAQIWMTFVSGLSLYFSLPRHIFGQCQQILFPKYFTLNAVLSLTMLILFIKYFFITWTISKFIQLCSLAATGIIEVVVRLYIAPTLLKLMHEKYRIEGSIGSGAEIGRLVQGDLTECPHYQRVHRAFRRLHMIVATGNIIALAASCAQLCYLAAQIQITI